MKWIINDLRKGGLPYLWQDGLKRTKVSASRLPWLGRYFAAPQEEEYEDELPPQPTGPAGPRIGFRPGILNAYRTHYEELVARDPETVKNREDWLRAYRSNPAYAQLAMDFGIPVGTLKHIEAVQRGTMTEEKSKHRPSGNTVVDIIDRQLLDSKDTEELPLLRTVGGTAFHIRKMLGKGGMGAAYLADKICARFEFPEEAKEVLIQVKMRNARDYHGTTLDAMLGALVPNGGRAAVKQELAAVREQDASVYEAAIDRALSAHLPVAERQLAREALVASVNGGDDAVLDALLGVYLPAGVRPSVKRLFRDFKKHTIPASLFESCLRDYLPDEHKRKALRKCLLALKQGGLEETIREDISYYTSWQLYDTWKDYVKNRRVTDEDIPAEVDGSPRNVDSLDIDVDLAAEEAANSPMNITRCVKVSLTQHDSGLEAEIAAAKDTLRTQYVAHIEGIHFDKSGSLIVEYEYVEGTTIDSLVDTMLDAGQLLPLEMVALFANHIAQGLTVIHKYGNLAHRDICTRNIIYSALKGYPVLLDFGLSKKGVVNMDMIEGKVPFMAPDIINGANTAANATEEERMKQAQAGDMYSLGCVLYEMLTGTLPHRNKDDINRYLDCSALALEKIMAAEQKGMLKPHEICPDIPINLSELVYSLLNPDWTKRPSAEEFESKMSKPLYLFDGLLPDGVSMTSIQDWFREIYEKRILNRVGTTPAEIEKDLNQDIRKVAPAASKLVLAKYRNLGYAKHPYDWEDKGWERRPRPSPNDKGERALEKDPAIARQIDYRVSNVFRTVRDAIGERMGGYLKSEYMGRFKSKTHLAQLPALRNILYSDATCTHERTALEVYDATHKLLKEHLIPVCNNDAAKAETRAHKYLHDRYVAALNLAPDKRAR